MQTLPSSIIVDGYRIAISSHRSEAAAYLSQRLSKAMGLTAPAGVDAGESARKLRGRVTDALQRLGIRVEVYASTRTNTWMCDVLEPAGAR